MATPDSIDSEIALRQDFEREDQDDSRSLRWSLLAALAVHAMLLNLALPASEVIDEARVVACSLRPSKQIYARSARGPSQSGAVSRAAPPAMKRRICNLFSDISGDSMPEPILEPEPIPEVVLEPEPYPRSGGEEPATTGSLGIEPTLTACVEPQWTEIGRRVRIEGQVILEILIQEDGAVTEPKVLKALPFGLDEAAVEAVVRWRYEPITVEGKPVALRHVVVVRFIPGVSNCPPERI